MEILIDAATLRAQPEQAVLLDCRFDLADPGAGREAYLSGHIPGAHYLHLEEDLSGPRQRHGGRHPLPDAQVFARRLAALGITLDTPVVAYDDNRFCFAARLWWMMTALGYHRVQLLDGGYGAWLDAGGELEYQTPAPDAVAAPAVDAYAGTVDRGAVQALGNAETLLVDARDARRYAGLEEPIDPVAGHIPGAVNLPWQGVTDERGYARPRGWQRDRWAPFSPNGSAVMYCGSGVSACVNLLSLELAGYERGSLYPGSWSDWCSYFV